MSLTDELLDYLGECYQLDRRRNRWPTFESYVRDYMTDLLYQTAPVRQYSR